MNRLFPGRIALQIAETMRRAFLGQNPDKQHPLPSVSSNLRGHYSMEKINSIAEIFAKLIVAGNIPPIGVGLAGEIITLDARFNGSPNGPKKCNTLDEMIKLFEAYDELMKKADAISKEFSESSDGRFLVRGLTSLRDDLSLLLRPQNSQMP